MNLKNPILRLALIVAALIAVAIPVTAADSAPPKPTYIPQGGPLTADLDANHFQIVNAAGYAVNGDETNIGANYVGTHEFLISVDPGVLGNGPIATLTAGRDDPSVTPPAGESPTVLIRWVSATHRELWFNTGSGWTKVAG